MYQDKRMQAMFWRISQAISLGLFRSRNNWNNLTKVFCPRGCTVGNKIWNPFPLVYGSISKNNLVAFIYNHTCTTGILHFVMNNNVCYCNKGLQKRYILYYLIILHFSRPTGDKIQRENVIISVPCKASLYHFRLGFVAQVKNVRTPCLFSVFIVSDIVF